MPLNDFIFSISLDYNYCKPSEAQRIVTVGIQKGYLELKETDLHILFNGQTLNIPITWIPQTIGLETINKTPLTPIDVTLEYHPVAVKKTIKVVIDLTKVQFLKEIPSFIALDGKEYGPFNPNDVAEVPHANAEIFIRRKKAAPLEPPPKQPSPSDQKPQRSKPKKTAKKIRKKPQKGTLDTFFGK